MLKKRTAAMVATWLVAACAHAALPNAPKGDPDDVIDVAFKSISVIAFLNEVVPAGYKVSYERPDLATRMISSHGHGVWHRLLQYAGTDSGVAMRADLSGRVVYVTAMAPLEGTKPVSAGTSNPPRAARALAAAMPDPRPMLPDQKPQIEPVKPSSATLTAPVQAPAAPPLLGKEAGRSNHDVASQNAREASNVASAVRVSTRKPVVLVSAPAPKKPQWKVKKGEPIHEALVEWAEAADWTLIWYPSVSWKAISDVVMDEQPDVVAAVSEVVTILRAEGKPIQLRVSDGNNVMEVLATEVKND